MNLGEHNIVASTFAIDKHSVISKISKVLETTNCSDQLVIAVYHIDQNRFLYGNTPFKRLLGRKMSRLLNNGWDFWFANICPEERLMIKNRLRTFFSLPFDQKPTSLRYHMFDADENLLCIKHEIVLHSVNKGMLALNYFFDISEKERIERYLKGQNRRECIYGKNDVKPISPREEEVLKLIADGYSSKQIADQLFISNHTAISHRKHLIEKFQVKNTAQLIKKASRIMDL